MCLGVVGNTAGFSADDPDGIKLNITAFADVRLSTSDKNSRNIFIKSLKSLKGSESGVDVLALVGESTAGGNGMEARLLDTLIEKQGAVQYNYIESDDAVYRAEYNDYSLIFVGNGALSDGKLQLIGDALRRASYRKLPIFVFNYSSVSKEFSQLMTMYPNTFVFAAGESMEFGVLYGEYDAQVIRIPGLVGSQGLGCQIEVYSDRVSVKQRNYLDAKWTDVKRTYMLENVPAPAIPVTAADVLDRYNEVVNFVKDFENDITVRKVENSTGMIDECPSSVETIVTFALNTLTGSYEQTLQFSSGVTAADEDGAFTRLNDFVAPSGAQARLPDTNAVESATATANGDGSYTINIKLKQEKTVYADGVVTAPNHACMVDLLDLNEFDSSGFAITNVDATYSGATITAVVDSNGMLSSLTHRNPLSAKLTAKVMVKSVDFTVRGQSDTEWTFTY